MGKGEGGGREEGRGKGGKGRENRQEGRGGGGRGEKLVKGDLEAGSLWGRRADWGEGGGRKSSREGVRRKEGRGGGGEGRCVSISILPLIMFSVFKYHFLIDTKELDIRSR